MSADTPPVSQIRDMVYREVEDYDFTIDDVREVSSGEAGTTVRILETDAEEERDQVGVDITYPVGPTGRTMFSQKLRQSVRALENHVIGNDPSEATESDEAHDVDGSDDDHDPEPETGREIPRPEQRAPMSIDTSSTSSPATEHRITLDVKLDADQTAEIHDAVADIVDDVSEKDERIDELEDRVDRLESALSSLANLSIEEA